MNIVTDYPAWFFIFCIIAGIAYSAILYYKDKKHDFSPLLIKSMAAFRFVSVFLISFLLLSPLIKSITHNSEKPIIIIAQDNSQSIIINKDSSFYKKNYKESLEKLVSDLSNKYDVHTFSFADKVSEGLKFDYKGKQTDISGFFDEMTTRYTNRNVGAIIIASDGIYNKGINPVYASQKLKSPVYTIALGDTNIHKDLLIQKVNYNRIVYLGSSFPIEIIVNANKAKGLSAKLKVTKDGKELFNKNINFTNDQYSETVNVQLEAKESGLQHYHITISPLNDEITLSNNNKDIFIEVLDSRQKILILSNAPHPDISAIKQTLEANRNYDIEDYLINDFNKPISNYNLVILHQLPSNNAIFNKLLADIQKNNIPVLFILGAQTNYNQFNSINAGLNVTVKNQNANEVLPAVANEFAFFTLSEETKKVMNNFPPLLCVYGDYKMATSGETMMNQKIGNVVTKQPLILFNQNQTSKYAVITGEGLWKWKLSNYAQKNNHEAFDELFTKIIQYLSVKIDKSLFKVSNTHVFNENQPVEFDAEVYNDSYELINDADVNIDIFNDNNKKFPSIFNKTSKSYHLNAGIFPPGDYKYEARVKLKNKSLSTKGSFIVTSIDEEYTNTLANHQMLYNLAKKHDGEMIYPNQLQSLVDKLNKRDDIKTVTYTQKRYNNLMNIYWIFFIILALLSAEWFLRKRNGGY